MILLGVVLVLVLAVIMIILFIAQGILDVLGLDDIAEIIVVACELLMYIVWAIAATAIIILFIEYLCTFLE